MRIYVPKFYRIQQKILIRSWDHHNGKDGKSDAPSIEELISLTKTNEVDVLRAVNALSDKELVVHNQQQGKVYCKPKGKVALLKEDVLEQGWEKFKVDLLRWTQIVGIASATTIGVATFILSVATTNRNKIEIEALKREVQALRQKQVSAPRLQARPKSYLPRQDSLKKK